MGIQKETDSRSNLKVQDVSMLQDEEIPQIRAKASCKEEKYNKKELEKGYTIQNFLKDLNAGKGYVLTYDIDQTKEGDYPITLSLENDLEKKIEQNWKRN